MSSTASEYLRNLDKADTPHLQGHHEQRNEALDTPFDYDEVDRRLGLAPAESDHDRQFREAADLLGVLCGWLAASGTPHSAGLRAFALAWTLRPSAFKERSLTVLAKRLHVTKQALNQRCSEVFRLSNGIFKSPTMHVTRSRADRAAVAREYHRRVGHVEGGNPRRRHRK